MVASSSPVTSHKVPNQPVVLVAEDDDQIRYLIQFLMEREGYQVVLARDGNEVKRLVEAIDPPQLVILDIMMPFADGFELLELIRSKISWGKVPVIMLTARSQEKDIVRAFEMGASEYIVKPFLPEELKARIRRLVPAPK